MAVTAISFARLTDVVHVAAPARRLVQETAHGTA
jgi:hypothetical protein